MSAGRDKSHGKWFNFMSAIFISGVRLDKLQNRKPGFSLNARSMKDFPIPEDPPVTMTVENLSREPMREDIALSNFFARAFTPPWLG